MSVTVNKPLTAEEALRQTGAQQGAVSTQAAQPMAQGQTASAYKPSQTVAQAQQRLMNTQAQKPQAYAGKTTPQAYAGKTTPQLEALYNKIMGRGEFKYDMNGDALWNQYKEAYTRQGERAMRDTMGQATALTGGYGSSYAQAVGNQAYNQYMQQLMDKLPEFEERARARYNDESQRLMQMYELAQSADNSEYDRYKDALAAWQADRSFDYGVYQNERDYDNDNYYKAQDLELNRDAQAYSQWLSGQQLDLQRDDQAYNQWLNGQKLDLQKEDQSWQKWLEGQKWEQQKDAYEYQKAIEQAQEAREADLYAYEQYLRTRPSQTADTGVVGESSGSAGNGSTGGVLKTLSTLAAQDAASKQATANAAATVLANAMQGLKQGTETQKLPDVNLYQLYRNATKGQGK